MPETAHQLTTFVTLHPETCCVCGVAFGMPTYLRKKRLEDHDSFYCPNGHRQHFIGKSEAERLAEQLAAERQRTEWNRRKAERIEHQRRALKGQLTKTRNRVGRGVCPCCNRSFENLRRHITTKHPGYAEATP